VRVPGPRAEATAVDPFDLPEWVGEEDVTWRSAVALGIPMVSGELTAQRADDDAAPRLGCDLLACDRAYPEPALPEQWRREAHSQWALAQVLLLEVDGRLTLVCPGVEVTTDSAMESLRRLAKAVGVPASRFTLALRL
jgi:hypothetical protein